MDVVLKLRIALDNGSILFGPGSEELFTLISETGSVSQAARKMGLSLSKAWKIVKDTEEVYGSPLVICSQGGKGGGKSVLTDDAVELVEKYRTLRLHTEKEANRKAKELLLETGLSLGEICAACGFQGQSYFTKAFRERTGTTPGKFREGK